MAEEKKNTQRSSARSARSNGSVRNVVVAALALFMTLLVIALIVNLVRLGAANSRKEALAEQDAALARMIEQNAAMIEYCESTEFIEEYAREWLDMIYRGETMIGEE